MINSFNTKGINYIESTSSIYTSFNFDLIIWEYIFLIAAASMHGVFFFLDVFTRKCGVRICTHCEWEVEFERI